MKEQVYSLTPFPDTDLPAIQITARVARENGFLHIQYRLTGETTKIRLPDRAAMPTRRADLWSNTCFEFFLAQPGDPRYWEFNLSPSGDWNVYRIDAYRRLGFREEMLIQRLQLEMRTEAGSIVVDAAVELSPLLPKHQPLQMGISSVIQAVDWHETYWALMHPQPEPDFHMRDSFIVHL